MKIAYRVFIGATLLMLAWAMGTAAHRDHPWFILGPLVVLGVVGAVRYGSERR